MKITQYFIRISAYMLGTPFIFLFKWITEKYLDNFILPFLTKYMTFNEVAIIFGVFWFIIAYAIFYIRDTKKRIETLENHLYDLALHHQYLKSVVFYDRKPYEHLEANNLTSNLSKDDLIYLGFKENQFENKETKVVYTTLKKLAILEQYKIFQRLKDKFNEKNKILK